MFRLPDLRVFSRTGVLLCVLAISSNVTIQGQPTPVSLAERGRGAEQVVIGRVSTVTAVWRDNDFGDRLITSIVRVTVDETLKGASRQSVEVEIEGGTIDGLTLRVSDLDTLAPGDRAVFYLEQNRRGALVPHLRGLGVQKIDASGRIRGTSVTLDQVRREVRAGAARRP